MASKRFRYTACGLDNVFLLNGYKLRTTPYGKAFAIDNIDGLHAAIGQRLIREKKTLNGKEIRFLRHELSLSQNGLATLLGIDEQSVARWEKGQAGISGPADKMIRLIYAEAIGSKTEIARMLKHIAELDEHIDRDFLFQATGTTWKAAHAA
jgi:putative transcriptional regulator